ncbi:helix-turn-helix domain-containing protein [Gryllotalpicola koreensis]|uniref:helix-turn-helix domain-containing protein n=1 Tax=Gryllotalpicola koreensis TaxID=993086 RepID=UPI003CD06BC9
MTLLDNVTKSLPARLKAARTLAGLDQTHMAQLLNVRIATISSWENGHTEPSFSQVVRWVNETGADLEWISAGVECAPRDLNPEPTD